MNAEKCCIISVGCGNWYPQGIERLEKSLNFHGWGGAEFLQTYLPEGSPSHAENPYAFKVYAFEQAIQKGFTHIVWLDASFWAVKNPMPLFDYIEDNGYFFFKTGYNLAQSCSDEILNYAKIHRDHAERINEGATGCIALNFKHEKAKAFFFRWREYMEAGMFRGSRFHAGQSKDPRFLFHRQDQSAASLVMNELEMIPSEGGKFEAYYNSDYKGTDNIFFISGM
jgi:hypothetical protein